MIKRSNTRYLSIMALTLCCFTQVNAVEPFTAGTGSPNNPFQIETVEQFLAFGQDPNLMDKCFVLMADLDLDPNLSESRIFDQSVVAPRFEGLFNGNHHTVRNLVIHAVSDVATGLFGYNGGLIQNLKLDNVSISGFYEVGIITGENYGVVKNCSVSGVLTGTGVLGGARRKKWAARC